MNNLTPIKGPSGYERIDKDALLIKQKFDIAEWASCCQRQNSYSVYGVDKMNEKAGVELLRVRETSGCMSRQCLPAYCNSFLLQVQLRDIHSESHNQPFLEIEKECSCTFMCMGRPEVKVHYVEDAQRVYIGKFTNEFKCACNLSMQVFNGEDQPLYNIQADGCEAGVAFSICPCTKCQTLDFQVVTPSGDCTVSTIQKRSSGCCESMATLTDDYAVNFPNSATVETKALLLSAAIFMDYMWFEKGGISRCFGMGCI